MSAPLIIQYTNLLHKHKNPNAKEVKAFLRKHEADNVFQERAKVVNRVFCLRVLAR
jgi:hypothetical protein